MKKTNKVKKGTKKASLLNSLLIVLSFIIPFSIAYIAPGIFNFWQENGMKRTYYKSGKLCVEKVLKNGKIDGEYKEYYENGQLKRKMKYNNGCEMDGESAYRMVVEKDGTVKSYYESGKLQGTWHITEMKYDDTWKIYKGKMNGPYETYHENGQLEREANFKNDNMDGVYKFYGKNGKIFMISNYKDGKLEGQTKIYNINGVLLEEAFYKDGKANGLVKNYYEDGVIKSIEEYKNNDMINSKYFDRSGKEINMEDQD